MGIGCLLIRLGMIERPVRVVLLVLLGVLAVLGGPRLAMGADEESWYVVQIGGKKAGHMRQSVKTADDRITTSSAMSLEIRRDASVIAVKLATEFVETAGGEAVSMRSEQAIGARPEVVEYRFTDAGVEVTRGVGDSKTTDRKPRPGGDGDKGSWLTPAAASTAVERALAEGRETFSIRTIDPAAGLEPITTEHAVVGKTTISALGRDVPAVEWTTSVDRYPGVKTREFVDAVGRLVRSTTNLGGMELVVLLADKDLALAKAEPPELLNSTMIRPDRPIERPRRAERATYIVSTTGESLADLPSVGAQTATRVDERTVRVSVDRTRSSPAEPGEAGDAALLASSAMVTSGDAEVVRLAEQAAAGKATPAEKAEALRRRVYTLIGKKDLDVGFASAAETARTRSGDCTEHAVLLAAMLRAQKIPSRVVSGLVYVEREGGGLFGYHMWTQALLPKAADDGAGGGRVWTDLDATLGAETPTDATHIALVVSTLGDDQMSNDLVRLVPLLGTLKIGVERVEHDKP